jgi:hypothetical protein
MPGGYAYVMNKLDFYLTDDPREKALRDAVYRAIARLVDERGTGPTTAVTSGGLSHGDAPCPFATPIVLLWRVPRYHA